VAQINITLTRFFGLSLALHAAVFAYFLLVQSVGMRTRSEPPPITVSILPPSAKEPAAGPPAPTKVTRTPAIVAKKDSKIFGRQESAPRLETTRGRGEKARVPSDEKAVVAPEKGPSSERIRDEALTGMPVPTTPTNQRDVPFAKSDAGERRLPTVKELLPPVTYSSGAGRNSAAVSLDTKDPVYLSYFNRIKQAIEQNWEYPELALRYGLQGRLSLEFSIGANGQLEQLRIIRSSGSQLLDDEALRAIRSAAPFPPIPSWIKGGPVNISASMEYNDNRVNYRHNR
jgi:protein TonB